jgi:hypothetical protein
MWMPTRTEPSGRKMTEKASSISVVAASSMLKAGASPAGSSGGAAAAVRCR